MLDPCVGSGVSRLGLVGPLVFRFLGPLVILFFLVEFDGEFGELHSPLVVLFWFKVDCKKSFHVAFEVASVFCLVVVFWVGRFVVCVEHVTVAFHCLFDCGPRCTLYRYPSGEA